MRYSRLVVSLLALALGNTACQKDTAEQPQPATPVQEATLNMTFRYFSPDETRGINYLADKPAGQLLPDRLTLSFSNSITNPTDQIEFTVAKSRQQPGLTGTYTLASQPDPGQGDVQVRYLRLVGGVGGNSISSNAHQLTGSLVITRYDAARKLVSGTYLVEATGVKDVFTFLAAGSSGDPRRTGDLRVYGSFTEVPLR